MSVLTRRRSTLRRGSSTPPTTIVQDTFTRADSSTTLGNAETGQSWTVITSGAVYGISSNQARQVNTTALAAVVVESGVSDCTIQVDVIVSGGVGLAWRDVDGDNNFVLATSSGTVFKKTAGTYASFQALGAGATGAGTYKVVLLGSSAKVYKDGGLVGTVTSTAYQTATRHGLYTGGASSGRLDNFLVTTP